MKSKKLPNLLIIMLIITLSLGINLIQHSKANADTAAVPVLTAGTVSGTAGGVIQVPVTLTSTGQITGLQFDLSYDHTQLTYQQVSTGSLTSGFTISANSVGDKQRVIIYNGSNTPIPTGSGIVAQLQFQVAAGAQGTSTLGLSGVISADAQGQPIITTMNNGQFSVSSASVKVTGITVTGAGNASTVHNGGTLQMGATVLPTNATNPSVIWSVTPGTGSASINLTGLLTATGEGTVTVKATADDGSAVIGTEVITITANQSTNPVLTAGTVSGTAGGVIQVPVTLTSTGQITGLQFDLSYDHTQLTYQQASIGSLTSGFTISANPVGDKQRVIIYNGSNSPIPTGSGTVAQLQFQVATGAQGTSTLGLSGVISADAQGQPITTTMNNGQFSVSSASVKVTGITVTGAGNASAVDNGGTLQMGAAVLPVNATDPSVTWSVTPGTGSASISPTGLLTATGLGTVTVKATAKDGSDVVGTTVITIKNTPKYTAKPIVQIDINPKANGSLGIFVGLDTILDKSGNTVTDSNIAGYNIEVNFDPTKVTILDVIDEANLGKFSKNINSVAGKVLIADGAVNGISNYSKLFFLPIALTGSALDLTNLQVRYLQVSDTNLDQINIENPDALVFHRGKIYNEASGIQPNINDAISGLQYLAGLKNIGTDIGQINPINMASIVGRDAGSTVIKSSVKDIVTLLQYLVELRDVNFTPVTN